MHLRTGLGAALDLPGLGAVDVVGRNPISVVGGGGRGSSAARSLLGDLGLNTLRLGALLAGLSGLALLREVGSHPNGVEEVTSARNTGQKEQIKEDAGSDCQYGCSYT